MDTPHDLDDHDGGLAADLSRSLTRRRLLTTVVSAAGSAMALAACSSDGSPDSVASSAGSRATSSGGASTTSATTASTTPSTTGATTTASTASTAAATCEPIPEETAGPYPGNGSNGPNVLTESGVVRSDIRSSIGSARGVADGIPLTLELLLTDTSAGCAPMVGAAVYLWHCDQAGRYSMYSEGADDENYLRGVQESDADGRVAFTSIFPACYAGRWPHIHFEVYGSLDDAVGGGSPVVTSQLAFPEDVCTTAYATSGYEQSVRNLTGVSLEGDNVFRDGVTEQLATVTGDPSSGYVATLSLVV